MTCRQPTLPPATPHAQHERDDGEERRLDDRRPPESRVAVLGRHVELLQAELLVVWAVGDRPRLAPEPVDRVDEQIGVAEELDEEVVGELRVAVDDQAPLPRLRTRRRERAEGHLETARRPAVIPPPPA